jgi:hypothetical protein
MPFFKDISVAPTEAYEVKSLFHFLRATRTLMEMGLAAKSNKRNYLEVAGILDGTGRTYALGGSPSKATIRRIVIFHVITGLEFAKKMNSQVDGKSKKRKVSTVLTDGDDNESCLSDDVFECLMIFA